MEFYSSLDSSQLNTQKPTIFEVSSSAQLDSLLTPSLRFLLAHYAAQYPRVLIRILNNFDELNAVVRGAIELAYLKTWNATFIEKFYGIKRISSRPLIPQSSISTSSKFNEVARLSSIQIVLSLLDTVGVPYFTSKLEQYHKKLVPIYLLNNIQLNTTAASITTEKTKISVIEKIRTLLCKLEVKLRDAFFKYYPTAKLSLKLITILLHILYLSDRTSSISIIQWLSKISYSRITAADHQLVESKTTSSRTKRSDMNVPPTLSSTLFSSLEKLSQPISKIAWSTTDTILPVSIFLLKFLEWYNTNRNMHSKNDDDSNSFETPIVPTIVPIDSMFDNNIKNKVITSTDNSLCRLCNKQLHNPGIIETGYVFCYKCIYEYLRDQTKEDGGKCPVTGRKLMCCSWSETRGEWIVKGLRRVII